MRRDGRSLGRALVLAAVLASTGAPAAHAQGADDSALHSPGCEAGIFAFLTADPAVVRETGQIPDRWKLALDSAGKARLFLNPASCQMTLGGRTRTVVWTVLAAQLDSASLPSPERKRSTSNVASKPSDYYLLAWSANDRDTVKWMQTGTGLGDVARFVRGLTFALSGGAERQFAFRAPEPDRSPFQLTATVTRSVIPVYPVTTNFWRETPVGSVMLEFSHDLPSLFGFFRQWTLRTAPTSPLGRMIGGSEQLRTCAATALPAPVIGQDGTDPGCLGVDEPNTRWTFRKDLPPGGGPGEGVTIASCLSRRSPIGPRNIGRVRLGRTRAALRRLRVKTSQRTRFSYRYCVKDRSGRVTAVFSSRARRARTRLIVTTARGHGNGGVRVRSRASAFRRAYPGRVRIRKGVYRASRGSTRLVGIRRGRVRFIAVATRSLLSDRATLRRALGRAGV